MSQRGGVVVGAHYDGVAKNLISSQVSVKDVP